MKLEDLTYVCAKIVNNYNKKLVYDLIKDSRNRAKILYLPIPVHAQLAMKDDAKGFTTTDTHGSNDDLLSLYNNTILTIPTLPSPTSSSCSLLKKCKFTDTTIKKTVTTIMNKLITNIKKSKLLNLY